jgi:organic hydroperoxide reductase OsmC/OhrA
MSKQHNYKLTTKWSGNNGTGTSDYTAYERSHSILIENKPEILCSADTPFRGDKTKHNPEDFLLASLSSCHMLWYLHLCADEGIIVVDYVDHATGVLQQPGNGSGHFTEAVLNPIVTVTESAMIDKALALHEKAHTSCFIANSVNFPVHHNPTCKALE